MLMTVTWLTPLAGGPAAADDGDGATMNVGLNQTVTQEYPAILGQDPATGQVQDHDPDTCRSVAEATCTVIPLSFEVPPHLQKYDVYTADVKVIWDPGQNVQTGTFVGADANDLDIYIWYDPYDADDPRYTNGSTALSHSASTNMPEEVKLDASTAQKFLLVVNNSNGVNNGFKVVVVTNYTPFEGVSESLDTGFAKPVDLSGDSSLPAAASPTSGVRELPASPAAAAPVAPASVTPEVSGLDPTLSGLSGAGADSVLNTGAAGNFFKPAAAVKPPKPVSGLAIVLSCGVVPILLVGLGAAWFRRRRPVALTI
jgi:hypothetical protein